MKLDYVNKPYSATIMGRSYGLSDHMIDLCVDKVLMTLLETNKKFLKLTNFFEYETSS